MRLIGIGTDIVEIARMQRLLTQSHAPRFLERVLHAQELVRFATVSQPASWLAKRFATKEALAKALGKGIGQAVHLSEIETCYTDLGKPYLQLHGQTLYTAQQSQVTQIELSVSDERHYAVAFVVLMSTL
ncbi:MAG: holo-ACP synthase [Thiotrichaceae bacterium]